MKIAEVRVPFLLTVFLATLGRTQETTAPPRFPAATEIVTVDAVVVDRQGTPVRGLLVTDFVVEEDGTPQQITSFEAVMPAAEGARPLSAATPGGPPPPQSESRTASNLQGSGSGRGFVIVFDELHLDNAEAQRARRALASFLEAGLVSRDVVSLVGTAEGTRWTARLPEGREALLATLARLQGRRESERAAEAMSDYEAMRIDRDSDPIVTDRVVRRFVADRVILRETRLRGDPSDRGENRETERSLVRARAAQVYLRSAAANETTLGLLERSLGALASVRGRKTLILASGGFVHDPRLLGFRRVVSEARRANVALYFLDARGLVAAPAALQAQAGAPLDVSDLGSSLQATQEASEGSESLAADTGGFSIRNSNDLAEGLRRIGDEAGSYYLLGFSPTNKKADGRFRALQVKVSRAGVNVRARRGYFAPGGARIPPEARDAALQRALDSPFDLSELPLRTTAHVFGPAEGGKTRVLLTTDADVRSLAFEEKAGTAKDTLEYLLVVADRGTGEFHRFDRQFGMSFRPETRARYTQSWFPVTHDLPLAPGAYQARVVARDANSGRLGSLTYNFEVPGEDGLRISTPLLSDRLREEAGAPRAPEATARRSFAPAGVLHCLFEVYGARRDTATGQPDVTAAFSVRRNDGRFLTVAPESVLRAGPDGSLTRTLGVPLAGAPAGDYELIVVVTDRAAGRAAEIREPFQIATGVD